MNEQELEKFVENQYNDWIFNNDISKVEDIDEKYLKESIEKDLAFVSKMTVQEYTLYEKWIEVHEKYKTAKQIVSLTINQHLLTLHKRHLLNQ